MKLSEIFTLKNGSAFKGSALLQEMDEASVRFLRPSKSMYGLMAGYVDESEILERTIIPADSIVVPTNGEGSLAYAVVYPYKAALGMDISALVPKEAYESDMTWGMKQYYAATIRANRFRYCYARKPKGRRLTDLDVPAPEDVPKWAVDATKLDEVGTFSDTPSWVFEQGFDAAYRYILSIDFEEFGKKYGATTNLHGKPVFPLSLKTSMFRLDSLFEVKYGVNLEKADLEDDEEGIPFVGRSAYNNGVTGRVAQIDDVPPQPAGAISVAGGGSVLSSFVQREPWYSGRDTYVLTPKEPMSTATKTFICELIKNHDQQFSYGRQANKFIPSLEIPLPILPDNKPDYGAIDSYMSSLSFSKSLLR